MKWEACIDDDESVEVVSELYDSVWQILFVFAHRILGFLRVLLKQISIEHVER